LNDWRTTEALFRYGLVREAADDRLTARERGALVRETATRLHAHPTDGLRQVARGTLDRWIRAYRHGGFEALKPVLREVGPRTDPAILSQAMDLRREAPERTGAQIAEILRRLHGEGAPAERTVQRHLAREGLRRGQDAGERVGFGRFEAECPNELWVADALHGPVVATERGGAVRRKAICFAILDDHSRLIVGAYFEPAETELRLERTLRAALQSRGVPGALYVDNGSPFASAQLARACAVLGIRLIHSKPGARRGAARSSASFALCASSSSSRRSARRTSPCPSSTASCVPGWSAPTTGAPTQRRKSPRRCASPRPGPATSAMRSCARRSFGASPARCPRRRPSRCTATATRSTPP
jgi:putative transposase